MSSSLKKLMEIFNSDLKSLNNVHIVNVYGSSKDKSPEEYDEDIYSNCKSWIQFWKKNNKNSINNICKCCKKIVDEDDIVGAHVYLVQKNKNKDEYNNFDYFCYTNSVYIVPICKDCNKKDSFDKYGAAIQLCTVMEIDKRYLVHHKDCDL